MADEHMLLGKNFIPPDIHGKVTGKAKYAEDFRAEGMVFCRLMLSPMPHAKVRSIDAKEALAMPGVLGILTADEVSPQPPPSEPILTNEPMFVGQPILAVAAESEQLAQDAIDKIKLDLEELPFTVDPLASLFPGGPDARLDGNVVDNRLTGPPQLKKAKWSAAAFAGAQDGQLPTGEPVVEWSYGDVDAGLAKAALVLDETFVTAGMSHHSMEPRSAMAYWENGKCFVFGSSQSQSFVVPGLAGMIQERGPDGKWSPLDPANLVYVAETCGGGFGSKGSAYPIMSVPAYMAKKINRPVMMRISRAEEYFLGNARTGFQGRIKIGFDKTGRVTAADLFIVQENGPTTGFPDWPSAGDTVSILYQPPAMRFRGLAVMTNTPPRSAQRGPGHNQTVAAIEPLIDKAAKQLGIDRHEIRKINGPRMDAKLGENRGPVTSCYLHDAREKGAALFNYEEKKKLSGQKKRHEGHRHRPRAGFPSSRLRGLRRHRADHARRQGALALRRRQPRHVLAHRHISYCRGGAEGELGRLHRRARRHAQELAVEHRPVRQQHVVHDGAHELRRGDGRRREAQGDRGEGPGRRARGLRHRRNEGLQEVRSEQEPHVRGGRAARDRSRR